jgi:hypothetical protein
VHGDDVDIQLNRIRNNDYAAYNNFDFRGAQFVDMPLNYVKASSEPATIKVMVDNPITGTVLGSLTLTGTSSISGGDFANVVYHWRQGDNAAAGSLYEESLGISRETGATRRSDGLAAIFSTPKEDLAQAWHARFCEHEVAETRP